MKKSQRIGLQIERATKAAGKSYAFNDAHPNDQAIDLFFQETPEGTVLFLVFYTLACRYSACTACTLPTTSSLQHVDYRDLMRQIDWVFAQPQVVERFASIKKVIVSNQGSVLDEDTFSSTALMYLVARINQHLPVLTTLCLETRPEYVDTAELEFLARALREAHDPKATLELAVGFEAYDEEVRNSVLRKGLSLGAFERVAELIAKHQFKLKCYFMQKPVVDMDDEQAVRDVQAGLHYFAELAQEHGIEVNMHLNPTYVPAGTPLEAALRAGTYTPPRLQDVAAAALAAKGLPVGVYLGLNDEGLAVDGGSFIRQGEQELVRMLEEFNVSQDFGILEAVRARP